MEDVEDTTIAPAILLAGDGERLTPALVKALGRRGLTVDRASRDELLHQAYVTAPDLVVLVGNAAEGLGRSAVAELAGKRATASIPVAVVVADPAELSERLDAFKHGLVSMIPRTASADEMAERIAQVAREVPGRSGEVHRGLAEASVDELVELFAQELRTGILSVAAGPDDDVSAQVVLHADRPVQEVVGELVDRLRPLVSRAQGPLRYEFFESASDRLGSLLQDFRDDADLDVFKGLRMVLVEQRAARSDALVQELRAVGATVVVADGAGEGLDRGVSLDPQVVVFDGGGERGWALGALRRLRRDPRLRWASVVVVDEAQLWKSEDDRPDMPGLAGAIAPLIVPDQELAERAERELSFDMRLESIGPSRLLRALAGTQRGLHIRVSHPEALVEVDVADGLVAGAMARAGPGARRVAQGPAAIATMLALSAGRVRVERKDAPARADVMSPVDDAFAAADAEAPLVAPSIPPPSQHPTAMSDATQPEVSMPPGESAMVSRLEGLITQLSTLVERSESLRPPPLAASRPMNIMAPGRAPSAPGHEKLAGRPIPGARTGGTKLSGAPPPAPLGARTGGTQLSAAPPPAIAPPARRRANKTVPPPPPPGGKAKSAPPPPPGRLPGVNKPPAGRLPSTKKKRTVPPPPPGSPARMKPSAPPPPPAKSAAPPPRPASARPPPPPSRPSGAAPSATRPSTRPPAGEGRAPVRRRRVPKATLVGIGEPVVKSFPPPGGRSVRPSGPRPASIPASAVVSAPPAADEVPVIAAAAPAIPPPAPSEPPDAPTDTPKASTSVFPSAAPSVSSELQISFPPAPEPEPPNALALSFPPAPEPEPPNALALSFPPDPTPPPALEDAAFDPAPAGAPVFEPTDDAPALPKSRLPLFVGVGVVASVILIGGSLTLWAVFGGDDGDGDPPPPTASEPVDPLPTEPDPDPTPDVEPPPDPDVPPVAAVDPPVGEPEGEPDAPEGDPGEAPDDAPPGDPDAPEQPATASGYTPLIEADPLEGSAEDFSLAALGIEPMEETSRRRRRRLLRELIRRANIRRNRGQFDQAEELYDRMLALDPENPRATVGLCRLAMAREQPALAVRMAQRLVRLRPMFASNWVLLGDTFELAGDERAALRAWTRAHDVDPRWRPARERLARVRGEGGP